MGGAPPMRPIRSGYIRHFFSAFIKHSVAFPQLLEASTAYRRKNELLSPRERRKGVISAPLGELRAAVLLRTNELLWLPRSARRGDGDETRSRATSGEAGGWADRNATFCCSFCARRSLLPDARGENSPAASRRALQIPSSLFGPRRAKTKPQNQPAPLMSDTFVCLR